jgi:hypothetical protein
MNENPMDPQAAAVPAPDALKPKASLLVKLGSIAVHVEELASPGGHHWDKVAVESLLNDPEVKQWIAAMTKMGMMPVKR